MSAATPTEARTTPRFRGILALAAANGRLLIRNRLTLAYGLVIPLLPLALLLTPAGEIPEIQAQAIDSVTLMVLLFPVFYNLLSLVVTRRDDLVLKRLRTGEVSDTGILASLALPGLVVAVLLALGSLVAAPLLGRVTPFNPVLVVLGFVLAGLCFAGLGLWTASWTRTAESAQITCMPIFVLAMIGLFVDILPERFAAIAERTPGAAAQSLVRLGWWGSTDPSAPAMSHTEVLREAAEPALVLALWAVATLWYGIKTMRWEPRT